MISALLWVAWAVDPPSPAANPQPSTWSLTAANSAVWNNRAYAPLGLVIDGSESALAQAKAAGITDVLVRVSMDVPWEPIAERLEAAGMRYTLQVNSMVPMASGLVIEPESNRIAGITGPIQGQLALPGATEALIVLVTQRDGTVQLTQRRPVVEGQLTLDVDPKSELEHVLLIYPMVKEARLPDYWSGFDAHRDRLLTKLRTLPKGAGLRGFLDPLGVVPQFPTPQMQFVPTAPLFQLEFERFLRQKYTTLNNALKSWSMTAPDQESFGALSKLVPLWSSQKGVPYLYDPARDRVYKVDSRLSLAWKDLQEVIYATSIRRYQRLVSSIKTVRNVPVLQTWQSWTGPYEDRSVRLEGIGVRLTEKSRSGLLDEASRAASTMLRWGRPGWLIASRLPLAEEDLSLFSGLLNDLESAGVRGVFVESNSESVLRAVAAEAQRRDPDSLAAWKPRPLYFPESAWNPAVPGPLPDGRWWFPAPYQGNRLDLGSLYEAYAMQAAGESTLVIWSKEIARRTRLMTNEPKNLSFPSHPAEELKVRVGRQWVELNIPTSPLTIQGASQLPIPQDALDAAQAQAKALLQRAEAKFGTAAEIRLQYDQMVQGLSRDPAGVYVQIRQLIRTLSTQLDQVLWLEAELSRQHNWTQTTPMPGCSNTSVLQLQNPLPWGQSIFQAQYNVPIPTPGTYEVWVAGQISPPDLEKVSIQIGDRRLKVQRGPLSRYGLGFGWYSFGSIPMNPSTLTVSLQVNGVPSAAIAADVVLLSATGFQPNNIQIPEGN